MVLDGEEDEALGVLLQKGLVGLLWSDGRCNSSLGLLLGLLYNRLLRVDLVGKSVDIGVKRRVLLAGVKVQLLHGRLHLEGLHVGSDLDEERRVSGLSCSTM